MGTWLMLDKEGRKVREGDERAGDTTVCGEWLNVPRTGQRTGG